jgi:hypothetical protein
MTDCSGLSSGSTSFSMGYVSSSFGDRYNRRLDMKTAIRGRPKRVVQRMVLGEGIPTMLRADLGQGSAPIFIGLISENMWVRIDDLVLSNKKIRLVAEFV